MVEPPSTGLFNFQKPIYGSFLIILHQRVLHPHEERKLARNSFEENIIPGKKTVLKDFNILHKKGFHIPVEISPSIIETEGKNLHYCTTYEVH